MNRNFHQLLAVASLLLGGQAAAQTAPASPVSPLVGGNVDQNQGLPMNETTLNRHAQDDALDRARESARSQKAVAAKPSDVTVGSKVSDIKGVPVGTIESVDAGGAVIVTADGKAKLALDTFGKNSAGLLIGVTKDQLEAAVKAANAKP